jgi:sec-independent protein translocase protein TatC
MTFLEHLQELRIRLTRCLIAAGVGLGVCYPISDRLFGYLIAPLVRVMPEGSSLQYTHMSEGFMTYLKVSFFAGLILVSPYVFYQIWRFVAPGLYASERKWIIPIAVISAFFFAAGAMFGYFIVFPVAFDFFMSYSVGPIKAMPKLDEYLDFSLGLLLAFGVVFETPLFIFFLARLGLVTATGLRKKRKFAVLGSFIVAAVLTPTPDAINQCLMAFPLLFFYELGILGAHFFGKKRRPPVEETEDAPAEPAAQPEDESKDVATLEK